MQRKMFKLSPALLCQGTPRIALVRPVPAVCQPCRKLLSLCRANNADDAPINTMTVERAYELLGVSSQANFEEIVTAKNKLLAKTTEQEKQMEIDLAYDLLFTRSMRKRLSGELEVSTSVRYADVPAAPARKPAARATSVKTPSFRPVPPKLPNPASGMSVAISMPKNTSLAATQAAVFSGVAVWAIIGAVLESPEAQLADTAGLQLACALAYSVYSLRENKKMALGKAVGLSMACLVAGAILGTLVEAWLRVDIVPILGFSSPGVLVAEFVIAACAAGAIFLI